MTIWLVWGKCLSLWKTFQPGNIWSCSTTQYQTNDRTSFWRGTTKNWLKYQIIFQVWQVRGWRRDRLLCLQREPPLRAPLLLHHLLVPGHRHGHRILQGFQVIFRTMLLFCCKFWCSTIAMYNTRRSIILIWFYVCVGGRFFFRFVGNEIDHNCSVAVTRANTSFRQKCGEFFKQMFSGIYRSV